MARKKLSIKGKNNKSYDLDTIGRTGSGALTLEVYNYNVGESPNPPDLSVGRIWISIPVKSEDAVVVDELVSSEEIEDPSNDTNINLEDLEV